MSAIFANESFHPEASRLVGKAWSGKGGKDFILKLKDLWKDDITMHLSMIVGLPPETEADYANSHKWCVDNKIDSWSWNRLSITPGVRLYSSEFDKNPGAFGFTYDYNTLEWSTAQMTQRDADRIAGKLNSSVGSQLKHTAWNAMSFMNYGIERQMLNTLPMHSLEHIVQRGRKPFIEQYKEKLKNISV